MSFADDAIGFYLQLDNTLSPELARAEKDYIRFTKSLTKWNTKAFNEANKGLSAVSAVIANFRKLPSEASKGYTAALKKVQKAAKPIVQKIVVELDTKSKATLSSSVQKTLAKVLSTTELRMSAVIPTKKAKGFDTSVSLRSLYRDLPQPPDMMGMFQKLPKFAKGGMVPGTGNMDDVLGMLTPGELVVPKDVLKELKIASKEKKVSNEAAGIIADIRNLSAGLLKLRELAGKMDLDPDSVDAYTKALAGMEKRLEDGYVIMRKLPDRVQQKFTPALKRGQVMMDLFNKTGVKTSETYKGLLGKILNPAQFLAFNKALEGAGQLVSGLYDGVQQTFSAAQGDQIDDYVTSINRMNTQWGLTRTQLADVKREAVTASKSFEGVSLTSFGEAMSDLANLRFNPEEAKNMAGALASIATATGTSTDSLAELAKETMRVGDLSQAEFEAVSATMVKQSRIGRVNMADLTQQTIQDISTLGAEFYTQTKDRQIGMINSLNSVAASMPDGWESSADDIRKLMVSASQSTVEGAQKAQMAFGRSSAEVKDMLASGNFAPLMDDLTKKFKGATDFMSANALADALQLDIPGAQLQTLGNGLDQTRGRFKELTDAVVPAGQGLSVITEQTKNSTTWFEKFSTNLVKSIGGFSMFGIQGVDVMDFFKEFNPQMLLSVGYLARFGGQAISAGAALAKNLIPGLAGMAKWVVTLPLKLLGLMKATKAASAVTSTAMTGAGGMAPSAKSLGETIAGLGKGIGQFAAGIGTGIGQAILGFMQGLSGGLMTLVPVLQAFGAAMLGPGALGFAALVAGLFAIAGAIRVAEPGIRVLGDIVMHLFDVIGEVAKVFISSIAGVFTKMIDQVGAFFSVMSTMDTGKILALSGGLLALGPAFIGLGAGMVALGSGLALSAPGIIVFSGAMKLLGMAGVGGMGLGGVVEGLLDAFSVDDKKLKSATDSLMNVVQFLGGFAKAAGAMASLGISAILNKGIDALFSYFGGGSPLANLTNEAHSMSQTVRALIYSFNFGDAELKQLEGVSKTVSSMATFTEAYGKIASGLKTTALKGAVMDRIVGLFTKGSPMDSLVVEAVSIKQTVAALGHAFGTFDPSTLDAAQGPIKAMAEFVESYTTVASGLQDVAPGIMSQLSDKIIAAFGGQSPMQKLAEESVPMVNTLNVLTHNFAALGASMKETPQLAIDAIKVASDVVKGFNPLAKAVEESGGLIGKLTDGWIFSGPMSILAENMPKFTASIKSIVGGLHDAFKDFPATAFDNVKKVVEVTDIAITGIAAMAPKLAPIADILARAAQRSGDVIKSSPAVAKALRSIVDSVGEVTGVQQKFSAPAVAPAQIQQAVNVQLDPATTDKPVHERLGETNALLAQLVSLIQQGGGMKLAMAGAGSMPVRGNVARPASAETQSMAGGNL